MEAEYIAASFAGKEIFWLRQMLEELMLNTVSTPTPLLCDNQSAIAVAKNPAMHDKAKHIAMKYHHIRELLENNVLEIRYCRSNQNPAHFLTKILPHDALLRCRTMAGLS